MTSPRQAIDALQQFQASMTNEQSQQIVASGIIRDAGDRTSYVISLEVQDDMSIFPSEFEGVKINVALTGNQ